MYILIALVVGAVIGILMKTTMTTVNPNNDASHYVIKDSMQLDVKEDDYLYSETTSIKIEEEE